MASPARDFGLVALIGKRCAVTRGLMLEGVGRISAGDPVVSTSTSELCKCPKGGNQNRMRLPLAREEHRVTSVWSSSEEQ
jgi:hypothetical protein